MKAGIGLIVKQGRYLSECWLLTNWYKILYVNVEKTQKYTDVPLLRNRPPRLFKSHPPQQKNIQSTSNQIKTSCLLSNPIPRWVRECTSQAEIIKSRRRHIRHKWKVSCHTKLAFHHVCQISRFEREAPGLNPWFTYRGNRTSWLCFLYYGKKPFILYHLSSLFIN